MSFTAIIPVASMAAANAFLENSGDTPDPTRGKWGPNNFSVPAYAGASPTHAMFHSWDIAGFREDVAKIVGVAIKDSNPADPEVPAPTTPEATTKEAAAAVGATWGQDAKPLTGVVTPGLYANDDGLWWVIQGYNTTTYPDPAAIPALIRLAKVPGEALPWVQPLDAFDAYKLVNPFTGHPDRCTHNGKTWKVTQADGAGNNTWEPGALGWADENASAQPAAWVQPTGTHDAYQIGAEVTHNGSVWVSTAANNVWSPGEYGWQIK